jgi:hypothetical protein
MIAIWNHDIARQRQRELLAAAERYRLARIAQDERTSTCPSPGRAPQMSTAEDRPGRAVTSG